MARSYRKGGLDRRCGGVAIQVASARVGHELRGSEADEIALGAAANGPRQVTHGGGPAAAGQDEILERRQRLVQHIGLLLEPVHALRCHQRGVGNRQLAAEIEQVVLDRGQHLDQRILW
jgi:hypothetical protein